MSDSRIGFILKGYPRLSETFISQEIHLLEERGFQIEIFSMRRAREVERHPVVAKIRAPVTYIPEYFFDAPLAIVRASIRTFLKNPLNFLHWFFHALKESLIERQKSPLKRFFQAAWLVDKKHLGQNGIRHLHTHFVHSPTELGFYVSKLSGLSYSISAHAKDIYTSSIRQIRERIANSKFLMTCTGYNIDFLKKNGVPAEKIHRVYHGICTHTFAPGIIPYSQSANRLRLVTCARLVPKKGYPYVLQALADLQKSGILLDYDIYGNGPLQSELEDLAKSLGIGERLHFYGNITQEQLIANYKQKGIFVLACVETEDGDRDGIPNAMAEAMSMELPVVATNISGIPELVENEQSGLLVQPRNSTALAQAIQRIVENPLFGDRLGSAARARVQAVFESEECIEECSRMLAPYR